LVEHRALLVEHRALLNQWGCQTQTASFSREIWCFHGVEGSFGRTKSSFGGFKCARGEVLSWYRELHWYIYFRGRYGVFMVCRALLVIR